MSMDVIAENVDSVLQVLNIVLLTVGLCKVFPKFGVEKKWAFVPFYRIYKLAQCADRELSGRLFLIFQVVYYFLTLVRTIIFQLGDMEYLDEDLHTVIFLEALIVVLEVSVMLSLAIYKLRIFLGICYQFQKKRRWVILFLFMSSIPLLIWGLNSSLQPRRRLDEGPKAAGDSGMMAEALDEGLTINIKEKTTVEFFKKEYLLRDIHMNIKPGHMVLLLGGSGAGKTTFVNAVTGYEKADAEILLNGNNVYRDYKKMKYDIGLVPQMDLMRYEDTVDNTLKDAAALRLPTNLSGKEVKERINKVLDIFGLTPVHGSMVEKLSGGQKKRLSIATEFICDPNLFILDEPDSGLDGVMARDLMERLHEISREGKIVIVITHTPDRVIDLFDDVIVLAKDANRTGRLAFFGPIDEARKFFGKEEMEEVVKSVNRKEEGGDGLADDCIARYGEAANGKASA